MALHVVGEGHPEQPKRLDAVLSALAPVRSTLTEFPCPKATTADFLRVHKREHVDLIQDVCERDLEYPDPDIGVSEGSWDAAHLAAGAGIAACEAVLAGQVMNAFCVVRPPGHHAERNRAMGFCLFNNIAVAARWLREVKEIKRVAIIDWDVHHGNGTEDIFLDDPTVFYASIHQHPLYPGTGTKRLSGADNTNVNVPMPPGCDGTMWMKALREEVLPRVETFAPDFLLISSGFDAHESDPLANQLLKAADYYAMTHAVKHIAGGRIVSMLEGGYNLKALGESAAEHVRALIEIGVAQ